MSGPIAAAEALGQRAVAGHSPPSVPLPGQTSPADRDRADEEQPRFSARFLSATPPWLVSLGFHLALVLVLALLTVAREQPLDGFNVTAVTAEPTPEELHEFVEIDLQPLEMLAPVEPAMLIADAGAADFRDLSLAVQVDTQAAVDPLVLGEMAIDEIGGLFGEDGQGMADISDGLRAAASFFGARSQGERFVFVVDNSNSMTRGRFETALLELQRTIEAMSPRQQFHVVFFSDTAYHQFHPQAEPGLIPATDRNKERLIRWLGTVEMCLHTRGEDAVRAALALEPDVIYILGDGVFTDRTTQLLTETHPRTIPIHTLGMEVDPAGERQLQAIAQANGGTYRRVSAAPEARRLAELQPRPRHRTRGPVWGVELPRGDAPQRGPGGPAPKKVPRGEAGKKKVRR